MPTITREELVEKGYRTHSNGTADYAMPSDDRMTITVDFTGDTATNFSVKYYEQDDFVTIYDLPYYPTLSDLESLVAFLTGKEQVCEWAFYPEGPMWQTSCGYGYDAPRDTLQRDGIAHCPYCGRKIVVKERDATTTV